MSDAPKPLTREEWLDERVQCEIPYMDPDMIKRVSATLDALFEDIAPLRRYRERTRGFYVRDGRITYADDIAREEGCE